MDHEVTTSPSPSPSASHSPSPGAAPGPAASATISPTEHAAAVVRELDALEDVAIDHHVAAFELAHAKLRGLLTDDGHLNHQSRAAS